MDKSTCNTNLNLYGTITKSSNSCKNGTEMWGIKMRERSSSERRLETLMSKIMENKISCPFKGMFTVTI
jgi:repressor of nif and glnA expression